MVEEVNDIRNWKIVDPEPSAELNQILPYSKRTIALIARNQACEILQTHYLQIAGASSILKGLEYHRDHFVQIVNQLAKGSPISEDSLRHEAVAYVNRVGQFFYFTKSKLVENLCKTSSLPSINKLMLFRHKHTSHLSVDWPDEKEDTEQLKTVHSMALSEYGAWLFFPKENSNLTGIGPFWGNAHVAFQIHDKDRSVDLVIERDHDELMHEAYSVFECLLKR